MTDLASLVPDGHRIVYRVEHRTQRDGPYMWSAALVTDQQEQLWIALGRADDPLRHPMPDDDGFPRDIYADKRFYYGFADIAQLLGWFGPMSSMLDEYGFVIRTYTVADRHAFAGSHQVAFRRRCARRIDEMRLAEAADVLAGT